MVREKVVYEEKLIRLFQNIYDDISIIAFTDTIMGYNKLFFRGFINQGTAEKLKFETKSNELKLLGINLFIDDSLDLGVCKLIYDNNFDINVGMEFGLLNPMPYSYYRKVAI